MPYATFSGGILVTESLFISGQGFFYSTMTATGAVVFSSTLYLTSAFTVASTVRASGYLVGVTQVIGIQQVAISGPTGGGTLAASDTEARTAISHILSALRTHGLIST